jgi:DNA-binding protein YbaB
MTDPLADTVRMIDNWERNAEEKAARFQEMSERVEQVSITESVADGAVSATVGHNGIPTDITMTDKVREMPPQEIAANVMAAIRKAQSRYPARLAEILAETVGDDDPASQHILATAERNFPPPLDDEADDEDPTRFSDIEEDERPQPPQAPQAPRPARPAAREDDEGDCDGDVTIFRE